MSETDKERGERLVEEACLAFLNETAAMDHIFTYATRRFARSMAAKGEEYISAGAHLAEYLLSDKPIGRRERIELAQMVLGEMGRRPTKPEMHPSHPVVIAVNEALRAGEMQKTVAYKFGISLKTVGNYKKMFEDREAAIAFGEAKHRQGHL